MEGAGVSVGRICKVTDSHLNFMIEQEGCTGTPPQSPSSRGTYTGVNRR